MPLWCESSAPPIIGRFAKYGNLRLCSHKAWAVLCCCGVRVLHHRYLVGSRNKVTFVSAHTKLAALCRCGVRVPHHRQLVGSRNEVTFISAHTKLAVMCCCGVRVPPDRCLFGLRSMATFVSAHTKPAVLKFFVLGLPQNSISVLV